MLGTEYGDRKVSNIFVAVSAENAHVLLCIRTLLATERSGNSCTCAIFTRRNVKTTAAAVDVFAFPQTKTARTDHNMEALEMASSINITVSILHQNTPAPSIPHATIVPHYFSIQKGRPIAKHGLAATKANQTSPIKTSRHKWEQNLRHT